MSADATKAGRPAAEGFRPATVGCGMPCAAALGVAMLSVLYRAAAVIPNPWSCVEVAALRAAVMPAWAAGPLCAWCSARRRAKRCSSDCVSCGCSSAARLHRCGFAAQVAGEGTYNRRVLPPARTHPIHDMTVASKSLAMADSLVRPLGASRRYGQSSSSIGADSSTVDRKRSAVASGAARRCSSQNWLRFRSYPCAHDGPARDGRSAGRAPATPRLRFAPWTRAA